MALETGIPLNWWGDPGVGKTEIISLVAENCGFKPHIKILSQLTPDSFLGIPYVNKSSGDNIPVTERAIPKWLKEILNDQKEGRKSVIILDEMNLGEVGMLKTVLQTISQKVIGEHSLGKDFPIITIGNPANLALYSTPLEPPMQTRYMSMKWDLNIKGFIDYLKGSREMESLARTPETWKERIPDARYMVADFIEKKIGSTPDIVYGIPENASNRSEMDSYRTPRTWTMAATAYAWNAERGSDERLTRKMVGGLVGTGGAREFVEYASKQDLSNPEKLLANPIDVKIPDRGDRVMAMLNGIVGAVAKEPTEERFRAAWKIIGRALPEARSEAVAAGRKLIDANIGDWAIPSGMGEILGKKPEQNLNDLLGGQKRGPKL